MTLLLLLAALALSWLVWRLSRDGGEREYQLQRAEGGLAVSREQAWAVFRLGSDQLSFRTDSEKERLARGQVSSIGKLGATDVVFLTVYRPYGIREWARQREQDLGGQALPDWAAHLDDVRGYFEFGYVQDGQVEHPGDPHRKEAYAYVLLGERALLDRARSTLATGPLRVLGRLRWLDERLDLRSYDGKSVGDAEMARWAEQVAIRCGQLSGYRAEPVDGGDVEWLIRHVHAPGLSDPSLSARASRWTGDDLLALLHHPVVYVTPRVLRVEGLDRSGDTTYGLVTHLSVEAMPSEWDFPEADPWGLHADALPFPVEWRVRAHLVPPRKARKRVRDRMKYADEERAGRERGGHHVPEDLRVVTEQAQDLEFALTRERLPMVEAHARLAVPMDLAPFVEEELRRRHPDGSGVLDADVLAAATRAGTKVLEARARAAVERFASAGVDLAWPAWDQERMLAEAVPGEPWLPTYKRRMDAVALVSSMLTGSAQLGDGRGGYTGQTLGDTKGPVMQDFWWAHRMNRPAGTGFAGESGSGKTTAFCIMLMHAVLSGAWAVVVDASSKLARMCEHPYLREHSQVFDVRTAPSGSANPWVLVELPARPEPTGDERADACARDAWARAHAHARGQQLAAAREAVRTVYPMSGERWAKAADAIERVDARVDADPSDLPSLTDVVALLRTREDDWLARSVGSELGQIARLPYGSLLFGPAPPEDQRLTARRPLTVLSTKGLTLPQADLAPERWDEAQRLSVAVLRAYGMLTFGMLDSLPEWVRKLLGVDEAWAFTSSAQGRAMVEEACNNGRKQNKAVALMSPSASHFTTDTVAQAMSSFHAFHSEHGPENERQLALLRRADTPENRAVVSSLGVGQSVSRDVAGMVEPMEWDLGPDRKLAELIYTTPGEAA